MITVANPQKAGPKGSYVAYEVRSQSTGGSGDAYAVVRRYSDFLWLHDELQRHNPSLVIPPMPEKTLSLSPLSLHTHAMQCPLTRTLFIVLQKHSGQVQSRAAAVPQP